MSDNRRLATISSFNHEALNALAKSPEFGHWASFVIVARSGFLAGGVALQTLGEKLEDLGMPAADITKAIHAFTNNPKQTLIRKDIDEELLRRSVVNWNESLLDDESRLTQILNGEPDDESPLGVRVVHLKI